MVLGKIEKVTVHLVRHKKYIEILRAYITKRKNPKTSFNKIRITNVEKAYFDWNRDTLNSKVTFNFKNAIAPLEVELYFKKWYELLLS